MATTSLIAPTATEKAAGIFKSRKDGKKAAILQNTKGTGLTFADLSEAQIAEACAYSKRVWGKNQTDRQKRMDALNDAISAALLAVYKGQTTKICKRTGNVKTVGYAAWDSERGPFHMYFSEIVKSKLFTISKIEASSESYSHAKNQGDEQAPIFNYSSPEQNPEAEANAESIMSVIISKLTPRENELLTLMLEDWNDEELAELLETSHGAIRKAKSVIRAKVTALGFSF
jgi:DNA-binding NarL/FixJ family response regulator